MRLRPQCHLFLGHVGKLQGLSNLHLVLDPCRQQLLSEIGPGQTLGKPPRVGTEESHVPVSPLLSTGTGKPSLLSEPRARAKPGELSWGRQEGYSVGKVARAALGARGLGAPVSRNLPARVSWLFESKE